MSAVPAQTESEILTHTAPQGDGAPPSNAGRVLAFASAQLQRGSDPKPLGGERVPRRDYSATLDLIREAQEAIRLAQEQNDELEAQLRDMAHQYRDELARAQAQSAQLEQRAKAAERRAEEAEGWLERLHQGITTAFSSR